MGKNRRNKKSKGAHLGSTKMNNSQKRKFRREGLLRVGQKASDINMGIHESV